MILRAWDELPVNMQNEEVRRYYDVLQRKKGSLFVKFFFDRIMALFLLILLSPIFLILGFVIKLDSSGEIFFRQVRITQYGKKFRIYKFRTMVKNAEEIGTQVTTQGDLRVTRVGKKIRACRLDEIPQLINILKGEMTFVGTRPEVPKYVEQYTPEMLATLLLPAGVTSEASIKYKDEEKLLSQAMLIDKTYLEVVLPEKMKWNYKGLEKFSLISDGKIILRTLKTIL